MKLPRKKKKRFYKWLENLKHITINPTKKANVTQILEDLYCMSRTKSKTTFSTNGIEGTISQTKQ